MESKKTEQVRFAAIVEKCGKPESLTIWGRPDEHFKAMLAEERVMTIRLGHGSPDYGMVGFEPTKDSMYLIFPKSLKRFKPARIVGIKYELIMGAGAIGIPPKKSADKKQSPPKPTVTPFQVTARVSSTIEVTAIFKARNKATAVKIAKEEIAKDADFSTGDVAIRILKAVSEKERRILW